jgi:hypothetical protein
VATSVAYWFLFYLVVITFFFFFSLSLLSRLEANHKFFVQLKALDIIIGFCNRMDLGGAFFITEALFVPFF